MNTFIKPMTDEQ